jgi:hypothetical protein
MEPHEQVWIRPHLQLDAKSDRVQIAPAFAKQNLREPLTVELLADAARRSFVYSPETDLATRLPVATVSRTIPACTGQVSIKFWKM